MKNKVILISIDGMRPDGFLSCGNPFAKKLLEISTHNLSARTVFPSVTLPCHMSMFHSVGPERHGITTNTYAPQVRPVNGICEQIKFMGGVSAAYLGWEPIRDVIRPGSLKYSTYINFRTGESVDTELTALCAERIRSSHPDFVFLYLVDTDDKGGHDVGWMSEEYLRRISIALDNVESIYNEFHEEYSIIVTSDHGGHDRNHGTNEPEDMTVPQFFVGKDFPAGKVIEESSILDIAPTVAGIMGIPCAPEWEGKNLAE